MTDISNIIDIETEPLSAKIETIGPQLNDIGGFGPENSKTEADGPLYGIGIGGPQTYIQK